MRQQAIENRSKAQRVFMESLNGPIQVFHGAFVHAYRPDWGTHSYGVVVGITPKKVDLSSPDSILGTERIAVAKHEVTLLDDKQWQRVDAELQRRVSEWAEAEKNGTTDKLPDYCRFAIDLT